MLTNTKLVSIGNFDLKLHHLLIIGILVLSFTVSFLLRAQGANFGFELNEFDPFFNYRATQYIVDNGIVEYFEWHDDLSWYPSGRDVSATSQVMLHLTAATTYWVFGGGTDLYDFTIIFPVVFGSLTAIVIFALVRVIGGTTAGLFSAMLYSISIPILIRSPIGWFKSEPLGLFFGIFALYLFLSGIKSDNYKIAASKLIGSGILLGFSFASWGGTQFFIIPIGLFIISLPFIRNDNKFLFWSVPLFLLSTILVAISFERPGIEFLTNIGGMGLIIPTIIMVVLLVIKNFSNTHARRNMLLFLAGLFLIIMSMFVLGSEFLPSASFRYLNAINPFLTSTDPLVDSVSEHATTTLGQSFLFHSVLMIFSGIGIWLMIKNIQNKNSRFVRNDMLLFSLIFGIVGIYISSTFIRLEVFAAISIIILSSLGLTALTREFFKNKSESKKPIGKLIKLPYVIGIIILLMVPMILPVGGDVFTLTRAPPTILNGGSAYTVVTNDWLDALDWMKNNTPKDAVVAAWWDYGYWISTMGERATLADNSTLSTKIIQNIATMFLSNPDEAWNLLQGMQADYILVFVAGEKLALNSPDSFYSLRGGGDESKKQWFMRIAEEPLTKYLQSDGHSGTDYFWDETLLGKMFPFSPLGYVNPRDLSQQSLTFVPGTIGIYAKDIKFPSDGDGPLRLVYASPSFVEEKIGPMIGVFIYEVNKEYKPAS